MYVFVCAVPHTSLARTHALSLLFSGCLLLCLLLLPSPLPPHPSPLTRSLLSRSFHLSGVHKQVRYAHGSQCYSCIQKRLESSVGESGGGASAAQKEEAEAVGEGEGAGRATAAAVLRDSSAQCSVMAQEMGANRLPTADDICCEDEIFRLPSAEDGAMEEAGSKPLVGRAVVYVVSLPGDQPIRPVGQ